jgi:hypothetical protein
MDKRMVKNRWHDRLLECCNSGNEGEGKNAQVLFVLNPSFHFAKAGALQRPGA